MAVGDVTAADNPDGDFLAGGILATEAGRQDEGDGDGGARDCRFLDKLAAGERERSVHGASGFEGGEAGEGAGSGLTDDGGFAGGVFEGDQKGFGAAITPDRDAADEASFG